jgi:hypothetical protein
MRASVPTGSTSRCGSSSMIDICCVDAIARPAGSASSSAARTATPNNAAKRGRASRIYLTVTLTLRLYTVLPATGAVGLDSGNRLIVGYDQASRTDPVAGNVTRRSM